MRVFLQTVSGGNAGTKIPIAGPRFLIGRDEDCHLRAHSDQDSRHHCFISVEADGVVVLDLGSRNGTFVDGERVDRRLVLHNGARLRVGPLEFLVVIHDAPPQLGMDTQPSRGREATVASPAEQVASAAGLPDSSSQTAGPDLPISGFAIAAPRSSLASLGHFPAQVTLQVANGRNAGTKIPIRRHRFLIGRADDCHLRVHNDEASNRHCEILVQLNGVLVLDLGSRNGTFVDGERVEGQCLLNDGARLKVGTLELRLEIQQPKWRRITDSVLGPSRVLNPSAETTVSGAASSTATSVPPADRVVADPSASEAPSQEPARVADSRSFDINQFLTSLPSESVTRPQAIDIMAEIQAMNKEVEKNRAAEALGTQETKEAAALGLKRLFTPRSPNE